MQTWLKNLFSLIKRDSLFCLQGHGPVAFIKITVYEWNTEVLMAGSAGFVTGLIHQQDVSRSKALRNAMLVIAKRGLILSLYKHIVFS